MALKYRGRLDEAIEAFRQATILRPNDQLARNNLENTIRDKRQIDGSSAANQQGNYAF